MAIINILDCGAVADGKTSCTAAIKTAIDKCAENGGGTVFVPAGTYLTGPIFLKSNINLNLEAGATLLFSNDIEEYPVVTSRWEGVKQDCYASLLMLITAKIFLLLVEVLLMDRVLFGGKFLELKKTSIQDQR